VSREESLRGEYSNCNAIVVDSEDSEDSDNSDNSEDTSPRMDSSLLSPHY
jgi:hypothetical protein